MAKVAIKYDNIVPYGGIFYAMNEFRRTGLGKLVDGRLNVRCANYGFQYSDIMLALFCVYLCGGDHIEDITTILNKYLSTAPNARIPSSDTIARGLKELRALSIAYTSKTGSIYAHDPALKLNSLLLDMTLLLGLLKRGQYIDVDFDNEFIPTEKSDALYSYKKKRGYFPGVMTSGPLIIGIENRQGNSNVKFEQVEELSRMLDNIESHGLYVRMFRADCGSFIKELVEELFLRTETFYLRASSCADRRQMYELCTEWRPTVVNGQEMDVTLWPKGTETRGRKLRGRLAAVHLEAAEEGVPALGYVVENAWLGQCLWQALDAEVVEWRCPAEVTALQALGEEMRQKVLAHKARPTLGRGDDRRQAEQTHAGPERRQGDRRQEAE